VAVPSQVRRLAVRPAEGDGPAVALAALADATGGGVPVWHREDLYAPIVQAAIQAGADRLVSEDLQNERRFGALTIENPFHRA
jgi:hypothetical protein